MAFFGRGNNADQGILRRRSIRIGEMLPFDDAEANVAVFGGDAARRTRVILQTVARNIGRCGIVLIHNSRELETGLAQLQSLFPEVAALCAQTPFSMVNSGNMVYEPLFGLSPERAVEAIYGDDESGQEPMQRHLCMDALYGFFEIMEHHRMQADLDSLLALVETGLDELEQTELAGMEEARAAEILNMLSLDNRIQQIRADVRFFARQLNGRIWQQGAEPTGVSMVEAVRRKGVLSVSVPGHHKALLNYFAAELTMLMEEGREFLLVVDAVNASESRLADLIESPYDSMNLTVSGAGITDLLGQEAAEGSNLLHRLDQMILFQSANARVAEIYSGMIGQYLRTFVSESRSRNRGAFDLFSGHGDGTSLSQQDYARIRPEEIASLGDGVILIDQGEGTVLLAGRCVL